MQVAKGNFSGNPVPNNEEFYKKVLVQFPFPTSKMELNIQYKRIYIRVAS